MPGMHLDRIGDSGSWFYTDGYYLFPILGEKNSKLRNMNIMSWGQAVKIGMGIIILGTLINIIYNHIFMNFIEPDFTTNYSPMKEKMDRGRNSHLSKLMRRENGLCFKEQF